MASRSLHCVHQKCNSTSSGSRVGHFRECHIQGTYCQKRKLLRILPKPYLELAIIDSWLLMAMAYALKLDSKVVPLTGMIAPEVLIEGARNTIVYEKETGLREHLFKLFATNHSPASQAKTLRELLCCLPKVLAPEGLSYNNLFRVLIVQFIDAEAFDVRSVKKSCIHIAHPDGKRLIPFDTFNM